MATITVMQFRAVKHYPGQNAPAPMIPEMAVTAIDTTTTTSLALTAGTEYVRLVSDTAGKRVSGVGAISGSNLGLVIPDSGQGVDFAVPPGGITLHFTDDS